MKSVRKRLTYANVMSSLALFLVVAGGSALAAGTLGKNTVGSKQLKKEAVTAAKIKNSAVTGGKLANGAVTGSKIGGGAVGASNLAANSVGSSALADNSVTGSKIANGSVNGDKIANGAVNGDKIADGAIGGTKIAGGAIGTGDLANGSVTREKLAAGERSEVLQFEETSSTAELDHPILESPTKIMTATLPAGQWVVTGEVNLTYSIEAASTPTNGSECFLADNGTTIAEGSSSYRVGLIFPSGSIAVTGISNGGTITLSCKSFAEHSFGGARQIIATRVGSVNGTS